MKKPIATLCAAVMVFSVAGIPTAPAISAPLYQTPVAAPANGKLIQEVKHRRRGRYHHRRYRPRHRRGNDAGAFIGGLAAGAILGGLLSSQRSRAAPAYRGDPHVQWCSQRYRSYDVRTDTFQPYNGPRRYCNSPYR